MILSKCGKEGCNPVEQTRGQMKPEDHHMQFNRFLAAEKFAQAVEEHGIFLETKNFRRDAHEVEDAGSQNDSDFRISCSKCGKATGWDRRDIEESRRHGDGDHRRHVVVRDGNIDAIRQRWNDLNTD